MAAAAEAAEELVLASAQEAPVPGEFRAVEARALVDLAQVVRVRQVRAAACGKAVADQVVPAEDWERVAPQVADQEAVPVEAPVSEDLADQVVPAARAAVPVRVSAAARDLVAVAAPVEERAEVLGLAAGLAQVVVEPAQAVARELVVAEEPNKRLANG